MLPNEESCGGKKRNGEQKGDDDEREWASDV